MLANIGDKVKATKEDTTIENDNAIAVSLNNVPEIPLMKIKGKPLLHFLIERLKRVSKRFVAHKRPDSKTELRFGAGISDNADEEIIPNPDNVGSNLPGNPTKLFESFDPSNFLKTNTYGQAPSNTTLTITYQFGGGAGMVMLIEPIDRCISKLKRERDYDEIIYMTPDGSKLKQSLSNKLSCMSNIIILCGHYKGIDQ